jgi:hypothetical protein
MTDFELHPTVAPIEFDPERDDSWPTPESHPHLLPLPADSLLSRAARLWDGWWRAAMGGPSL